MHKFFILIMQNNDPLNFHHFFKISGVDRNPAKHHRSIQGHHRYNNKCQAARDYPSLLAFLCIDFSVWI